MNIGKRLREARREAGLSQAQLAKRVGMKQPTISELEKGDSQGSKNLVELAAAVNVTAEWLASGRGPKSLAGMTGYQVQYQLTDPSYVQYDVVTRQRAAESLIEAIRQAVSAGVSAEFFESLRSVLSTQLEAKKANLTAIPEIDTGSSESKTKQVQKGRAGLDALLPAADNLEQSGHERPTGTGKRR